MLSNVRIVLINTTHPGNIGAVARAMKTMGLTDLRLVEPARYPDPDAVARAAGAADILDQAIVHATLDEALADTVLVVGTSARQRHVEWPMLDPHDGACPLLAHASRPVAILFGREHSGLTNEELQRCDYLVQIPANPEYSSLNIAAAVQIICYEIWRQAQTSTAADSKPLNVSSITQKTMENFYRHLEQTLVELNFLDPQFPRHLMPQLRRLFNRARPDERELNILRGILTAAQKARRYKQ
jgi:TrmH family RNA methyltransferase